MADDNKLRPLLVFPIEAEVERERFRVLPVVAIFRFLECFTEEGRQAFDVPIHVLEALVERLGAFARGECKSLDEAFGGQTRRQRNAIVGSDRNAAILWDYFRAHDAARRTPKGERIDTPSDDALEQAGERHRKSAERVRTIRRKAGKAR